MQKICVISGAGISAESGLKTFRDGDGLWENHAIEDVATPEAWYRDPELVLRFYNERRAQVRNAKPNAAHFALAQLEKEFEVDIVTQNIDDLHERAGSSRVLHLHGEVLKSKTEKNPQVVYSVEGDIALGDCDEAGDQLRPHVVWFGEAVPEMDNAVPIVRNADVLIVVGTSLAVYPAAGLLYFAKPHAKLYLVDPNPETESAVRNPSAQFFCKPATEGVPEVVQAILLGESQK